ncbi:MAG: peptide/nickel transport system permease protein [Thermomicrobiales bacterium]|jgi:peptide/nickel transport system permease protein|nr:peptide/nickel transport system permease protein [Thermomicrobiales bacterium]
MEHSQTLPVSVLAREVTPRSTGRWRLALRAFVRHRLAAAGLVVIALIALATIAAPLVAPYDPNAVDLGAVREGPSGDHLLGTDEIGRDVFSRVIYGGRVSLSVGLVSVTIYTIIGILLGSVSGYFGGVVDGTIQRLTDTVMCFPSLVIIIAAVAILGPSIYNVMIVIGLLSWPGICRLVRAQFLSLREREFVEAARSIGGGHRDLIFRHILPNTLSPVIVAATFGVASAILTEAGLSFLGLGVQPPTPSWGNLINTAQSVSVLQRMPWLWIPAGLLIAMSVLSINFIGDGLRDALDPRARDR